MVTLESPSGQILLKYSFRAILKTRNDLESNSVCPEKKVNYDFSLPKFSVCWDKKALRKKEKNKLKIT